MINKAVDPNSRKRLKTPLFESTPSRIAQNAAFHKVLNQIYKMIDSSSKLLWAADNSIRGKPRRSQSDKSDSNWKQETNACLGYGELTKGALTNLLAVFQNLSFYINQRPEIKNKLLYEPQDYDLEDTSSFLDIGSGFGKPVFHAALQTGCLSHGIEVVPARVQFCIDFYFEYLETFKNITRQALNNSDQFSGEEEVFSPQASSPRKAYAREIADYQGQMQIFDLRLELERNEK